MRVETFEEAKRLAIEKWEYLSQFPMAIGEPECALCDWIDFTMSEWYEDFDDKICGPCPLNDGSMCAMEYGQWLLSRDRRNEEMAEYWAKKLLKRIESMEEPRCQNSV
jgi:hypothetical protein